MKTKLMKKMIALICAAAMTTSCATASVGAVKYGYGVSNPEEISAIGEIDQKVRLSINTIGEIMEKVEEIKGHEEATKILLSKLDKIKSLLQSTADLELFGQPVVEPMVLHLKVNVIPTIMQMNKYFLEYRNDSERLLDCLESDCDEKLTADVEGMVKRIKFSDEISKKYSELNKAKRLLKQISNPEEQKRLKELCEKAEKSLYNKIHNAVLSPKRKDNLLNLANEVISEINKALDAQKKEENKRKEEEKEREYARKREQLIKEMEREDREREEKRKQEELAAKKQKEELANKKEELKQQEHRLQEELDKLNKRAEELGNLKAIDDGWYTGDQLPVIRCLFEIDYKLQEVRGELNDMDMPKMFTNMKSGSNRQKEKELVRKKFEINRKYVNLSNELKNIEYLSSLGIDGFDSKKIESEMKNAEKEMTELNKQIKEEIENRNKFYDDMFKLGK